MWGNARANAPDLPLSVEPDGRSLPWAERRVKLWSEPGRSLYSSSEQSPAILGHCQGAAPDGEWASARISAGLNTQRLIWSTDCPRCLAADVGHGWSARCHPGSSHRGTEAQQRHTTAGCAVDDGRFDLRVLLPGDEHKGRDSGKSGARKRLRPDMPTQLLVWEEQAISRLQRARKPDAESAYLERPSASCTPRSWSQL